MPSRTYARPPGSPDLCLHIITYGSSHGDPEIRFPILLHFDLSTMHPPPRHLTRHLTGLSPQLAYAFFSIPGHEASYRSMLSTLEDRLLDLLSDPLWWRSRRGQHHCVAVLVNCTAGRHRSVAVAERLTTDVERGRWEGVTVEVEHMDTDVEREIRRGRVVRSGGWGPGGLARGGRGVYECEAACRAGYFAGR